MKGPLGAVIAFFASMKLAVVVLVLLGLLTWLGTLAQVDKGLYEVQKEYFEGWFVLAQLPVSVWGNEFGTLVIPLPGAYPLMVLLFINLVIGGMVRLKVRWRNAGVLITHVGIGLLLIAGFVKLHYSVAGYVSLFEAESNGMPAGDRVTSTSEFVSFHDYELALLRDDGATIVERTIPEAALHGARDGTIKITDPQLPFQIELHHWLDNCKPMPKGPMFTAPTPVVDGVFLQPRQQSMQREANIAGCYAIVTADEGARHEGVLVGYEMRPYSRYRYPFVFEIGDVRYGLDLRRVIRDLPFEVRLDEFRKKDHPGTMTPADFRSFVTVNQAGQEQKEQIYMNHPLRRAGFVLYQTNWGPQLGGGRAGDPPYYSVFEAAENPSDKWPEWSCYVIALGLAVHFLIKLILFLQSSSRKALVS